MADGSTDLLMIIIGKKGRLHGEGLTDFAQRDPGSLSSDFFTPVFELKEFTFAAGAASSLRAGREDAKANAEAARTAETAPAVTAPGAGATRPPRRSLPPIPKPLPIDKVTPKEHDVIDMQPIEYTRVFDAASTQLMTALVTCETLKSISIIKRKAAATRNAGEAYLRLDFTDVLMIGLDWKESGNVIEETGTFIYRKLKVRYRTQTAKGTLDATKQAEWAMKA